MFNNVLLPTRPCIQMFCYFTLQIHATDDRVGDKTEAIHSRLHSSCRWHWRLSQGDLPLSFLSILPTLHCGQNLLPFCQMAALYLCAYQLRAQIILYILEHITITQNVPLCNMSCIFQTYSGCYSDFLKPTLNRIFHHCVMIAG